MLVPRPFVLIAFAALLAAPTVVRADDPIDFERDIVPVLTRFGCNSGACHGKSRGQNGFQLSLLGFDPRFDYDALTRESRGRRVFVSDPRRSLLLRKPTGQVPHGGGIRFAVGDPSYVALLRWIEAGIPPARPETPKLVAVDVEPREKVLARESVQPLKVTAGYSDGSNRDVTGLAAFLSNEAGVATVDEQGRVKTGEVVGDAAITARYMGKIAVFNVAVPLADQPPKSVYKKLPRRNFIDGHVWAKLARLGITPSETAGEVTFLRRAYVDVIGRIPTSDEARAFLADRSPDKRKALIDRLLNRPEFADFWANKWVDLLRPNPYRVGMKAVFNFDNWIRASFRANKPYNQFVRELVTARGSTFRDGNTTLFRDRREPEELATIVSQLFLGTRLECAKCHHHPFEVWGQENFYEFAAYFSQVGHKGTGLSPPISGSEEMIYSAKSGSVTHPRTGELMRPTPLFGKAREIRPGEDPREVLADWMTSPSNVQFAETMANRVWADMMGRGLVEPVDDLRMTNPPSNGPLLASLGRDFRDSGFDLKHLVRTIAGSHAYELSSIPNERNAGDARNYSRHYRRRLRAETLLDAVVQVTGVPDSFRAMPPESRAMEIWTHRVSSPFLDTFGRPDPNQDPPCERITAPSVVQVLHLMNSTDLYKKVADDRGRAAALASGKLDAAGIVRELYLSIYAREPLPEELTVGVSLFKEGKGRRRESVEDLMWALLNTPEFLFDD